MSLLLHVLSDMLQNPQLLSHIHICVKPKVKLGPTDLIGRTEFGLGFRSYVDMGK